MGSEHRWGSPRRTNAASPWLEAVSPRNIGLVVLVGFTTGNAIVVGVVLAVIVVVPLVVWWRRTWSFDGHSLTLDDGILHRTYRRVPVERVQHVELNEPLIHRLAGLAVLRIETAGGAGQAEVALDALPRREAAALQAAVIEARATARQGGPRAPASPGRDDAGTPVDRPDHIPPPPPPPPPPEEVVLSLTPGQIMVGGMVSSNLLVVFAFMGTLFDLVSRLPRNLGTAVEREAGDAIGALGVTAGIVMLVGTILVVAALAALAVHYDLTVVRSAEELRMRRGLFERRDAVVPLRRVQSLTIRQNPAQRILGVAAISLRSAGVDQRGDVRLSIPVARHDEVARIVEAAVGRPVELEGLVAAPRAARGRRIVRRLAVVAALTIGAWALPPTRASVVPVAAALVVAAVLLGLDAYRNLGHRMDGDVAVTRWGSMLRRTSVVLVARVQSVRVRSSPFQRRRGLATLAVDLAGSGIAPVVLDQSAARCESLAESLRQPPVSSHEDGYATLGPGLSPRHNEEP